ncbi:MAG: alpha/beta hydrolase [Flavobacteriales bacterium]
MSKKHLIFLHGFLENAKMWNPILNSLDTTDWQLHLPEIPGHGNNAELVTPNMLEYVENIHGQLQIPADEPYFFIGHSMGGYMGAHYCTQYAENCIGLLLFHSKASDDDDEKKAARNRAIEAAQQNQSLYVRTMINGLFPDSTRAQFEKDIETQISYAQALPTMAITNALTVMRDRESRLQALIASQIPVHYFLGSEDKSIPQQIALAEIQQLPNVTFHLEQNVGHMGHIECVNSVVDYFGKALSS